MNSSANTLGRFVADLMKKHNHNNSSLAAVAGVSESVIRNLLKHGLETRVKDPDPRTLRRVADALDVDAIMLFRLAGYIPPQSNANSVRAEYLADVFDELPPEKQDAVMSVLEAMSTNAVHRRAVQEMRDEPDNPVAGIDDLLAGWLRMMANKLIAHYQMEAPLESDRIEPDVQVYGHTWKDLPAATQRRIKALIEHKLSLDYDPTMVDPKWRG
jgi:transcriptional regulator with XRE-family HTH domain